MICIQDIIAVINPISVLMACVNKFFTYWGGSITGCGKP